MQKYRLVSFPSQILRTISTEVEKVDEHILDVMSCMREIMQHNDGLGIAANQIGVTKRIILIDTTCINFQERDLCAEGIKPGDESEVANMHPDYIRADDIGAILYIVNPKVVWTWDQKFIFQEGCLSLPNELIPVSRSKAIRIEYLDQDNKVKYMTAFGTLAVALQHEIDHLNGRLAIDYLSKLKKDNAVRRLNKAKKVTA